MKLDNNNNVSFGAFETRFQRWRGAPINRKFTQRISRLKKAFAEDSLLSIRIYDVFSPQGGNRGIRSKVGRKRIIGGSVNPVSGYVAPNCHSCDFMITASHDFDGAEFIAKLKQLAQQLREKCIPDIRGYVKPDRNSFGHEVTKPTELQYYRTAAGSGWWDD